MESTIDSMCRCCAAEGIFKDIKTSYHWMGEEEVYGDMLRECFDVKLASIDQGGICEVCITQLRNAANFKKQVVHTERKFKRHLDSRSFKPTEVKEELSGDNANSSDDDHVGGADSEDDEDYVPEFEIPIKTESPEESKSRKRAAKASASTSRAKKSRAADEDKSVHTRDNKPIKTELGVSWEVTIVKVAEKSKDVNNKSKTTQNRKQNLKQLLKPDKISIQRTKTQSTDQSAETSELDKHRYNVRTILQYSNATPIRTHSIACGYTCCFCKSHFPKAADLKTHTIQDHDDGTKNIFMQGTTLFSFIVKLDITALCCNICNMATDTLEQLTDHLNNIHQKGLHADIKSYIACFKLDEEALKCHICFSEYKSFKCLLEHMNKHSTNFICDECGAGFINLGQLRYHSDNIHTIGVYKCGTCDKVFPSSKKKYFHERASHFHSAKKKKANELLRSFVDKQTDASKVKDHA